jgi:glycerate 2-kinase
VRTSSISATAPRDEPPRAMNRGAIERAFARALRELDPAARVTAALRRSRSWSRSGSAVHVIAIGKAAPAMAAGALDCLGDAVARCLVVAPDGTAVASLHAAAERAGVLERVETMRAGHPLPDTRSVRAGRACLSIAKAAANSRAARLVVLVSGGASALTCAPARKITLRTKRAITRTMLESGASIHDVNVVRKHLSQLKGGGLVRAAGPAPIYTLVVSDVIGGTASDVGSGPSVPDATTVRDARRLVSRFAPRFADVPLVPTLAGTRAVAARTRARLVASPEDLGRTMASTLRSRVVSGVSVRVLAPSQASVASLAEEYVALAIRAGVRSKGASQVFVRAAEPSVAVMRSSGRGGRCTHLAALVGRMLGERMLGERDASTRAIPPRIVFAALASDGVDGGSGTGGAIIDATFARRAAAVLGDGALARALLRFDTGALHRSLGTAIVSRPTGHNLADLHVLVVG